MAKIFRLDIDGNVNAVYKLRSIPQNIVKDVNSQLKSDVGEKVKRNVKMGMPVSKRSKQHMKTSNSLVVAMQKGIGSYRNYGITIKPTDTFWYMKFPNNGSGTSRINKPKQFVQIGLQRSTSIVNATISRAISKNLN